MSIATGPGFAEWVRPHLGAMARLAARLAPAADRDDVVQEALTRAWLKRGQYDPARGAPSAWLLAIAADQARKAARRSRPLVGVPDGAGAAGIPDERVDLQRALDRLTDRQRLAVDCVYFAGLTTVETAAVMGCAVGTVKSTLADARTKLRTLLEVAG
ncbi:RNA polymerase sigma factor [Winogradskya humida]|uniref:RNA polymerase sigma factor n=1 Tax=Winogradskya humida TaxID=113566 RepID=A0ABQ4A2T1_9ACTN|nr:RNA polymerase sigma factor [Actinoplanes humidus]GIE25029.1 RNA polymerase sigma factor [Actinoplanes humidus]